MSTNKRRTITLTDRRPITINEEAWPLIALAEWHDSEYESQAIRRQYLRVRQHADGRTIVYATSTSRMQGSRDYRGGELVTPARHDGPDADGRTGLDVEITAAIRRVADRGGLRDHLIDECIADLPAEELDASRAEIRRCVRALDTRAEIRSVNDRYRAEFENALRDRELSERLTSTVHEDGLDEATEGQETDIDF